MQDSCFALIVGGGMSGITIAAQLLNQKVLRRGEFFIVDRWNDYGGVWEANKYPGAACDVPSHAYVLPFHLNPGKWFGSFRGVWSRRYASQPEIQSYYASVAQHYRLRECTFFNTRVMSAIWDEKTYKYTVLLENAKTGAQSTWISNVVVDAGGQFWKPKYADIPGSESFKGAQWHTAEWRSDYDLRGKRVAMIGTGPSTAQLAPKIKDDVKELVLYQRSATYCIPRKDHEQPAWKKFVLTYIPFVLWFYHLWWYLSIEFNKRTWLSGTREQHNASEYAIRHLESTVRDPITREKLRPTHQFGCKRILVLDEWYPLFNEPHVKLITDKPLRITENGVLSRPAQMVDVEMTRNTESDSYNPNLPLPLYASEPAETAHVEEKFDVILWGTGFDMTSPGQHFDLYGINGTSLKQLWTENSPHAYYSVVVNQFPNFFMMLGPNSANFWSNLTLVCLVQARFNVKMIKKIKEKCKEAPYALHISKNAEQEYNKSIYSSMGNIAILSPGCHNYYTNDRGEATLWSPMHGWTLAWRTWWPKWADFHHLTLSEKCI